MASEGPHISTGRRYGQIGKYEIVAHLASGGMCVVYRAVDPGLGREVALKVLPPELANQTILLERFRREARNVAKLRHENIVTIYEFGEASGVHYLALEYVDGIDLERYIAQQVRLDPEESCVLIAQAARALDHLHKYQIVHRDIKPGNLLLSRKDGQPLIKLTDLGIARVTSDSQFRMTKTGHTLGTVDYMSPEQARNSGLADIRSDLYSLGCTWYHMLAGRTPFSEGGLTERLYQHLKTKPTDVRQFNPRVSQDMVTILEKLMAKKPGDRYATPAALLADLAKLGIAAAAAPGPRRGGRARKKEAGAFAERPTVPSLPAGAIRKAEDEASDLLGIGPEQRQAAAGQCERAKEVLKAGNLEYAIHLLLSACKLDPANTEYRRALRKATKLLYKSTGRSGQLSLLPPQGNRTKLKAAKTSADHLKVLEDGERYLLEQPDDVNTQLEMAGAAEVLGLRDLAVWILEHAMRKKNPDLEVCRSLARAYELRKDFRQAIAVWEIVHGADPTDAEAAQKSRDLAATETIARGRYTAEIERRWGEGEE
ncbi:MAG TPA: serine/threonine-protein kinase [Gemmataceae bacterium]|nr:serine/threonine-protein kinase [Gemmataceae bacterium]